VKAEGIANAGWQTVALGEVATVERSAIQPKEITKGTAYLGLEHIESGGKILGAKPVDEGELASSKFKFTEQHVLYGKLRPYLAKISCPDFSGICSTDILPILPGPNLERRYLCYFLRQPSMIDYASSRAVGINLPRIASSSLVEFRIPLPPLSEQRRIAEVLDRVEALRSKRRVALAQLDFLTQSIFLDLFGNPATNPKDWPKHRLGEIAYKITDGEHQTPKRTTRGIKLLSARNVRNGFIDVADVDYVSADEHERIKRRCNPELGDVLISCSGTIGRVATITTTEPLCLVRSVALVKPNRTIIDSTFLEHYLRTPALYSIMQRSANASSQANLFQGQIRELPAMLPPIALQREFARQVAVVEKLKTVQRASLGELDALFNSLQYRAFRGEL
jgi:type I restriction enzyme, S subunit